MYEVFDRVLDERPTAVLRGRLEVTELSAWIGPAFGKVIAALQAAGLEPAGPPFVRYTMVSGTAAQFDVEAGFPLKEPLPEAPEPSRRDEEAVHPSRLPGGNAAVTVHLGPYEAISAGYEALEKWINEQGGRPDGSPWEIYWSEPVGDPDTWRTELVQPYRTD